MKALVVYESMFGNTEQIARAVAAGLEELFEVPGGRGDGCAYRTGSRRGADRGGRPHTRLLHESDEHSRRRHQQKARREGEREFGLREWMAALPSGQHTEKMATFDTKIESMHYLPGVSRQEVPPKPPAAMGTSPLRKPRASTSVTSTARYWTVRLTLYGLGVGSRRINHPSCHLSPGVAREHEPDIRRDSPERICGEVPLGHAVPHPSGGVHRAGSWPQSVVTILIPAAPGAPRSAT